VQIDDPVGQPAVRIDSGSTINALQFRAIANVGPTVDLFSSSFTANTFPPVDGAYHDVGSPLSFTGDGSPVRLSAAVQITNQSSVAPSLQVIVQLTVDGTAVGHGRYVTVAANGYAEANLEELVTGLAPGSHTVRVQIDDPVGEPAVRIDDGSTINAVQFRNITPAPTPTPTPTPAPTPTPTPAPVHLTAILFTNKVGKKNVQFIRVTSSAGGTPREIRSPFQSTAYKGITVVANDSNDSIVVTGTKKLGRKTSSITLFL
jgi:hypothetical protein